MIGFDADDYWADAPAIAKGNYNLWRLMIDKAYQGKRYGKEAVKLALEFIRTYPCGDAEYCWLSYEPENRVAAKLYSSFGFEETGDMDGEERIAVLRQHRIIPGTYLTCRIFRHIVQKYSAIHKVLPAFFEQSDENSDGAIYAPELCGVALI